jgi:hypothetical protein
VRNRIGVWGCRGIGVGCVAAIVTLGNAEAEPPVCTLQVVVDTNAPAPIRDAAQRVLDAAATNPVLQILAEGRAPAQLADSAALAAGPASNRALSHLVLVGLPSDPLVARAWQREARMRADGGLYVFGFGHFRGDIGYLESDRNPFLHSQAIDQAPFETEVITLSGATPAGVALAVDAFLRQGLVNGVVAAGGWQRAAPSLLERDPLAPDFAPPEWLPRRLGEWRFLGLTQAAEDEYRGVLADAGVVPVEIWRAKYWKPGVWDPIDGVSGQKVAPVHFHAGLHRRSHGNTLWLARFASVHEAGDALNRIAAAAGLRLHANLIWRGSQPPLGYDDPKGDLTAWHRDEWAVMSTLPADVSDAWRAAPAPPAKP